MKIISFSVLIFMLLPLLHVSAQVENNWLIESGLTISHFQQQVKSDIGGPKGDELINNLEFGFIASGYYKLNQFLSVGFFTRFDTGKRSMALFDGFDVDGKTQVINQLGGTYTEYWFGLLVRGNWKMISLDIGYAPIGIRRDGARNDIPSHSGNTSETFKTHPTIAWLIAPGGNFLITEKLIVILKVEYRVRYYNKRGSENLFDDINLGSQSISPIIGVAWNF